MVDVALIFHCFSLCLPWGGVFFFHPGAKRRKKRTHRQTEKNEGSDGGRPEGGRDKCQTRPLVWRAGVLIRTDGIAPFSGPSTGAARSGAQARVAPPSLSFLSLESFRMTISQNSNRLQESATTHLLSHVSDRVDRCVENFRETSSRPKLTTGDLDNNPSNSDRHFQHNRIP